MNASQRYRPNTPKISHETIEGDVIVINFENGNYYSLNGTAANIWHFVTNKAALNEIVTNLEERYQPGQTPVQEAVYQFIGELEKEELICTSDDGESCDDKPQLPWSDSTSSTDLSFDSPEIEKFTDVQDLLLLDPIHSVDETGWPAQKPEPTQDNA